MTDASQGTKRVTLRFQSDRGRDYLYDDVTGAIFPWSTLREDVLALSLAGRLDGERERLVEAHGARAVDGARRMIEEWRNRYGAFVRPCGGEMHAPLPAPEALESLVRARTFELLLVLTENCNLRCKYCALSETYPLNRQRTTKRMSLETARRAIDWYAHLVGPQMAQNPRKRFGLSFYGGEPLLNMRLVTDVLGYCRDAYPHTFLPVMTTNGLLLTPDIVETLVEHDVMLAISIDGPQEEHDRLRRDIRDRGTFERIAANLRRIKADHPEYWQRQLTSVSVYDWGTDLEAAERFFDENADVMPRTVFVNAVGAANTQWYDRYSEDDRRRTATALERLRARYKQAKIDGADVSHYLTSLVGIDIYSVLLRRRLGDNRVAFLPYSGACMPGDKIAVHVDGRLDMCERVSGRCPIGHLDRGGIDFEQLGKVIEEYRDQVTQRCERCPATKHCSVCFSHVETEDGFRRSASICANTVAGTRQRLADYVSILEDNPEASFQFETDTASLEQRLLLQY